MAFDGNRVSDLPTLQAGLRPDEEAVRAGGATLTWRELDRSVDDATAYLAGFGIGEDTPVGLALGNSLEHVILVLALMRIGAAPVEFPPETPVADITRALGIPRAEVVFVEPQERQRPAPVTIAVQPHWRPAPAPGRHRRTTRTGDDLRIVFLTSGSTGTPRMISLTQRALLERTRLAGPMYSRWWSRERPGTVLIASTLAHAAFLQWLIDQMTYGGRTILLPQYVHGGDIIREMAGWRDAVLRVVPNLCRLFLQAAPAEGLLFPHMHFLNCTGLPLYPHEKRDIIRRVTPNFGEDFGATGCGPITGISPDEMDRKAESVGRAFPEVDIVLRDGRGDPVAPGMAGRVEVRGPGMVPPALQERAASGAFEGFADGWCRTGDVGRLDADGFLHFIGRAAERIAQDGIELYPEEIEAVLSAFPGVADAAVVGHTPPGRRDDVAVAVIVGPGFAQRYDIAAHCAARLPPERRPRSYLFADALPLTATGKVDRAALKTYLAANPPQLSS